MKKFYLVLLMGIVVLSSCSDVKKADKLRLEHKFDEAAALYQKAADKGDAYAMWRLGNCYSSGDGVEYNEKKAYEWIVKAAEAGCEEAKADMACTKFYGWYNQPKNVKKGIKQLSDLVAKTGNPYVIRRYAGMFWDGVDGEIETNTTKADSIINTIKDKNNPNYLWFMGLIYNYGTDLTEIDENKAIECWEKSFEKGNIGAKQIAELYRYGGNEIEKDIDKAVEWYKKGVEVNGSGCMEDLARIYLSEASTLQKFHNPQGGITLLKKAIKHGNGDAADYLGYLYSRGENVEKDDKEAFKYFKIADEYGSANGALNLGVTYLSGRGVEKDQDKAIECYERAAERGSAEAAVKLGEIYRAYALVAIELEGDKDKFVEYVDKGNAYLEKGAKLGSPLAYYILGEHYYNGSYGYPEDNYQAFVYFKKAADAGWVDAYDYLIKMYENGWGCEKNPTKAKEYRDKKKG